MVNTDPEKMTLIFYKAVLDTQYSSDQSYFFLNPVPYMLISASSNSAADKDMMAKIWTNEDAVICLNRNYCGKRRNCSLRAISPFPTMFSKTICCYNTIQYNTISVYL